MKPIKFCIDERVIVSHEKADMPVGTIAKLPTVEPDLGSYWVAHDGDPDSRVRCWTEEFIQSLSN